MGLGIFGAAAPRTSPLDPAKTDIDNLCYDNFGDGWWDASGPLGGLHELTPVRARYFDDAFRATLGEDAPRAMRFADVGCGGGILTEAMARLGYRDLTGFDVSEPSLEAARRHAAEHAVRVTYRSGSAYATGLETASVDGVIISDVLEHLHDLPRAAAELARILRPGGVLVFDTINRTVASYLLMIVAAERALRLVPERTHDWRMFITPGELRAVLTGAGFEVSALRGITPASSLPKLFARAVRDKRLGEFELSSDLGVSYVGHAVRGPSV